MEDRKCLLLLLIKLLKKENFNSESTAEEPK